MLFVTMILKTEFNLQIYQTGVNSFTWDLWHKGQGNGKENTPI